MDLKMHSIKKFIWSTLIAVFFIYNNSASFAQTVAEVKVGNVERGSIPLTVVATGTVSTRPLDKALITSVLSGKVGEIVAQIGERVKKGQVILKLEVDRSAQFEYEKAKIALKQAEISHSQSKQAYEAGVIPKITLDQAQTNYNLAKSDMELKRKALDYQMANSSIPSPISGIVADIRVSLGETISGNAPLAVVENLSQVVVDTNVDVKYRNIVDVGDYAEFSLTSLYKEKIFSGEITKVFEDVDPASQTFRVWVWIDNKGYSLKPGMFGRVNVTADVHQNVLVVPRSALIKDGAKWFVYTVKNDAAEKRDVAPGIVDESLVEIEQGLNQGETVVVEGGYELSPGMKVKVLK